MTRENNYCFITQYVMCDKVTSRIFIARNNKRTTLVKLTRCLLYRICMYIHTMSKCNKTTCFEICPENDVRRDAGHKNVIPLRDIRVGYCGFFFSSRSTISFKNEEILSSACHVTCGRLPSPDNFDRRDASLISTLQKAALLSWNAIIDSDNGIYYSC